MTSHCLSLLSKIDRQSERIDLGRLLEPAFNLSSILIYASMTMKGRLGGAAGGSPARPCAWDALCLQMWAAERLRLSAPAWFPCAPGAHANGCRKTDIHASILYWIPAGTDVLSVNRNNIFYAAIRLKTFNYACSRQPLPGIRTAADRLRAGSSHVCITLLGRIQGCNPIVTRLRHFNSTLSPLVRAVSAYKTADYAGNPINGLY